jgi:hypothetical protein
VIALRNLERQRLLQELLAALGVALHRSHEAERSGRETLPDPHPQPAVHRAAFVEIRLC